MKYLNALMVAAVIAWSLPVRAVQPDEMLPDPKLEARARAISEELRCLVCQNESIDQSEAPLAHDLRLLVRRRILAGDSDQQIINYLVARYGEFILLRPPLSWNTIALWGAPPALLLLGGLMILVVERRRRKADGPPTAVARLSPAEEARLAEILHEEAAQ